MRNNTKQTTLTQAAGLLSLGLFLQVVFTYPVWMYDEWRVLPTIPLLPYFSASWLLFDYLNFALLTVPLIAIMFVPQQRHWYLLVVVVIMVVVVQDAARFQYGIYVFTVLLGLLYFQKEGRNAQLIQALQMGLIGVYLWAGIYQLSPYYTEIVFPNLWWWADTVGTTLVIAYLPGLLAIVVAIGLFFPRSRLWTLGVVLIYHLFQLSLYFPPAVAEHPMIWTFHLVMICLAFLVFGKHDQPVFAQSFSFLKTFPVVPYAFLIFVTFPLFQFATHLPPTLLLQPAETYPLQTTYSFHRQDRFCLSAEADPLIFVRSTDYIERKIQYIQLSDWFSNELGVPYLFHQEQQRELLQSLCNCLDYQHQGTFQTTTWNLWTLEENTTKLQCTDLK